MEDETDVLDLYDIVLVLALAVCLGIGAPAMYDLLTDSCLLCGAIDWIWEA